MKPGSVLAHALQLPARRSARHTCPERRAGAPRCARPRGSWASSRSPHAPRPRERCPAGPGTPKPGPPGPPPRGGKQSSEPALAEAATGLTLFPQLVGTQGRAAPRRGPRSPQACKEGRCGAPGSAREIGSFPDKGLRGAPGAFLGTRTAEPERPGPGAAPRLQSAARSGAGDEPSAACPPACPPARPPSPGPVTWVLPGVGGGGGRGVGENAGVTLRAAPRHEAAAPVLGRGHGPGRRGGKVLESEHPRRPRSPARGLEGASF